MKWKKSEDFHRMGKEPEGDFLVDEDYPIWQKPKNGLFGDTFLKKLKMPFIVLGAGLVILIILFVVSISGRDNTAFDNQVVSIEKRLLQIEDRMNRLELNSGGRKQIEEQNSKLVELNDKISRLEASVSLRMDQISAEVNRGIKETSTSQAPSTSSDQTTTTERYHRVKAGETLYSIGKRYGLKMDELLRLNKMKSGTVIYPGQKIVVKR